MTSLSGKRALVTGAAQGVGYATAVALGENGVGVIGLDIEAADAPFPILACDLAIEAHIVTAVAEAARRLGGLDIIVNNAGIMREASLADTTAALIDRHFAVNVRGTILVAREALPHLGPGARIVNVASDLAYLGRADASVYAATKAAILGLTRSWARELAPDVLVNAVAPGPTDTALLRFESLTPAQKALETSHPLGRIARPEEIANAILFLVGPQSTFVTGHCLGANGGAAMA